MRYFLDNRLTKRTGRVNAHVCRVELGRFGQPSCDLEPRKEVALPRFFRDRSKTQKQQIALSAESNEFETLCLKGLFSPYYPRLGRRRDPRQGRSWVLELGIIQC